MTKKRASIRLSANGLRIIEKIQEVYPHLDRTGAIEHALVEWERKKSIEERLTRIEAILADWQESHTPGK